MTPALVIGVENLQVDYKLLLRMFQTEPLTPVDLIPVTIVILGSHARGGVSMSIQTITDNFRMLSPEEKVRVLQDLWDEIADDAPILLLSESHRQLLDERLRQHDKNADDVESWQRVRDDILG